MRKKHFVFLGIILIVGLFIIIQNCKKTDSIDSLTISNLEYSVFYAEKLTPTGRINYLLEKHPEFKFDIETAKQLLDASKKSLELSRSTHREVNDRIKDFTAVKTNISRLADMFKESPIEPMIKEITDKILSSSDVLINTLGKINNPDYFKEFKKDKDTSLMLKIVYMQDLLLNTSNIQVEAIYLNTDWKKQARDTYKILVNWVSGNTLQKRIASTLEPSKNMAHSDVLIETAQVLESLYFIVIKSCEQVYQYIADGKLEEANKQYRTLKYDHFAKFSFITSIYYSIASEVFVGYKDKDYTSRKNFEPIVLKAIDYLGKIIENPSVVLDPINDLVLEFTGENYGFMYEFKLHKEIVQEQLKLKK